MARHGFMRSQSSDGTKYNLFSWALFCAGICFFLFFVTFGSLITPPEMVPHILICFIISGSALVLAAYAVFKLMTFRQIKMSRLRASNDDERTVDSDPASQSRLQTGHVPIDYTTVEDSNSRNPSFSPPTDSLIGLVSGESLRSRSWMYLASEAASCRFRRSISYDSSVSSVSPYAYGTFQQPDSTTNPSAVNETYGSRSSMVEHPIYAVPNKGASSLGARTRSGLIEDPSNHLPLLDSSPSHVEAKMGSAQIAMRSRLEDSDCYSNSTGGTRASTPRSFSNKNEQGERLGLVEFSNPLYGASYAKFPQISSGKDNFKNPQQSALVKDSIDSNTLDDASCAMSSSKDQSQNQQTGLVEFSNPLYGASYSSATQISSSKDLLEIQKRKRSVHFKDSGHTYPLNGASYASSPQMSSGMDQSKNRLEERAALVKNSGHSNPLDDAACTNPSSMLLSKDPSQNQKSERLSLLEDPYHLSNGASYNNSDHGEQTDQSPIYYYPSSSSSDKTTDTENPFVWPKTYQSSESKSSESPVASSVKEPTEHGKRLKGKKVSSASKAYLRKLQKRQDKKLYLKGMRVKTVKRPQVYVGLCTYGPSEELKVIFTQRLSSYSSEVSTPDEEGYRVLQGYMGPTRV